MMGEMGVVNEGETMISHFLGKKRETMLERFRVGDNEGSEGHGE
jgi:hypothetical protein